MILRTTYVYDTYTNYDSIYETYERGNKIIQSEEVKLIIMSMNNSRCLEDTSSFLLLFIFLEVYKST